LPYLVAEEEFPTKAAITRRAREILARTPDGQAVGDTDAEFLLALFQHHDEWVQKSASGVLDVSTQTTVHGTRCFVLRGHDGTTIDISFPHAVRLIPSTRSGDLLPQALRDFRSAARSAVAAQIHSFRDKALQKGCSCPVTGTLLVRGSVAVDHAPPNTFDSLLFQFCQERGINPLQVTVGSAGGVMAVLTDLDLRADWQTFHQSRAELRLLSKLGNLQLQKVLVQWSLLWA